MNMNHIKLMDSKVRAIAEQRYSGGIAKAYKLLYDYWLSQPNIFAGKNGKYQCYNYNKFIEMPYHAYKITSNANQSPSNATLSFDQSEYLIDLSWLYAKLKATKCVQYVLSDVYLLNASAAGERKHIVLLKRFLETHIQALNYDAEQFYPMLKRCIKQAIKTDGTLSEDTIVKGWITNLQKISHSYLEIINSDINENDVDAQENGQPCGYDSIVNLGDKECFVASLSTARGEICVYDASR